MYMKCSCMTDDPEEIEVEYGSARYVFEWDGNVATLLRVEDRLPFTEAEYTGGLLTPVFNELRSEIDEDITMDDVNLSPAELVENI